MELGAQLYTVREHTRTLDEFSLTLQKIANIGYKTVQVSGTCSYEADWLHEQLRKTGLRCVLTDYRYPVISDYVMINSIPLDINELGYHFLYHNHAEEFSKCQDGRTLLEKIADDFPQIGFVLDTYWIQAAGGDPAWWIRNKQFAGRVKCVHLKDMAYDSARKGVKMAPVYEGNINFDAVLDACRDAGTQHLLVEQDDCCGEDSFECLKKSYRNLKARGI
jgi:sugar phosphate isomerase/epimerase